MNTTSEVQNLFETVVKGGYCIGCGACASLKESPIQIKMNDYLQYEAYIDDLKKDVKLDVERVCPFSNKSLNEDEIGASLFKEAGIKHEKLGYVLATYAGYVAEESFRENGSSGGMGTWILAELLKLNLVDGVIHVKQKKDLTESQTLFEYAKSEDLPGVLEGAKSRYYPVEISKVVKFIKEQPGRYAIVGLPCFIKSIRLLTKADPILRERIHFCVGLVCGHIKSARFASMWAWQLGIHPDDLRAINFRAKLENYGANQYGATVRGIIDSIEVERTSPPLSQLYGSNWGWGLFKHKACDYCDDVVAETADVSIGDAWLPQYVKESQGTNVIVIRNPIINQLIENAHSEGRLQLDVLDTEAVVKSQSSGFNHRREGLAYRLHLTDQQKLWRPNKRVAASSNTLDERSKAIQDLRIKLAHQSHIAFKNALKENSFETFKNELAPLITRYRALYSNSPYNKFKNKIRNIVKRLF